MKRTTTPDAAAKPVDRRALLRPNSPLAKEPDLQAFLDNAPPDQFDFAEVQSQLVFANEAPLLLELYKTTQCESIDLSTFHAPFFSFATQAVLNDHLFPYVAEHLGELSWIQSISVEHAVLTQAACTHLQAFLQRPDCQLAQLSFSNCAFPDAQVHFPDTAPTVEELNWTSSHLMQEPDGLLQVLPSATHWPKLASLRTVSLGKPFPYAVLAQMLLHNKQIGKLSVGADRSQSPAELFNALKHDRTGVHSLELNIATSDMQVNEDCLLMTMDCLNNNNTLMWLELPGITACSTTAKDEFVEGLRRNRSLISLLPLPDEDAPIPHSINRNMTRQLWFTQDFIRGAAEAFMLHTANATDPGAALAFKLYSTPVERVYCAAVVGMLCKTNRERAIRLRSAGLRAVVQDYILSGDKMRCLELLGNLVRLHIDLLPDDKAAVVAYATSENKIGFLPAGYAPH